MCGLSMSRSSSTGDLVPRDITEVLALQSKVNKGKKNRGSSLSRAFSWFKGSKPKRSISNDQSRSGSLSGRTGEFTTTNHESSKVGQKQDEQWKLTVHYTASQHYQENVFIEGSRPKYLEDLHTEAQEGLKILQQEEHNKEVDVKDGRDVSTDSPQEKDLSCQERDGRLDFNSTAEHSSHITSTSNRPPASSRPVLTRQGSTFKPLNTVKRPDKTRKKTRRTTIMGIPQHVQRELCIGRGFLLQQLPNGDDSSGTVIIPTIDGGGPIIRNHEGAHVHLQDIEALQASRDEQLLLRHHLEAIYGHDLPRVSPMQRPKSLAVPGMTTMSSFLQEQGPVMSISPQATYLSTIIPNAILPASIDVIEIDRTSTRRSVRTVSKNSLTSASPGSSRSGGFCTHDAPASCSSKRCHSQSSETIVSNSSTISLRGNKGLSHATDRMKEDLNHDEQISVKSSSSWLSSRTKAASHKLEHGESSEAGESVQNGQFSRSLSIMKAKLPPAPPRRTYSLHQEKCAGVIKPRSCRLDGKKDLNGLQSKEQSVLSNHQIKTSANSPVTTFLDNSLNLSLSFSTNSPDQESTDAQSRSGNSSPQNKFERTMSPSSGYSSQSGTPTHSSKDFNPNSPGKHKKKPPKPERIGPRTSPSPVVSVSSSTNSLSSAAIDPNPSISQTQNSQLQPPKVSPDSTALQSKVQTPVSSGSTSLRDLFNIPPPPRVKAPCPPPPETWAHNTRTVELLCGPIPCPNKIYGLQKQHNDSLIKINQDTINCTNQKSSERRMSQEIKTTEQENSNNNREEEVTTVKNVENLALKHKESPKIKEKEDESCLEIETASCLTKEQEKNISENPKIEEENAVTSEKVSSSNEQHMKSERNVRNLQGNCILTPKIEETGTGKTEEQFLNAKTSTDKKIPAHKAKENNGVEVSRVNGHSPPPSPPPTHHPPPPPSKRSPASSVSTPLLQDNFKDVEIDLQNENPILESAWPPPPPPMDESIDLVFEEQDDVEFPPPPPPTLPMQELLSDVLENCNLELTVHKGTTSTEVESKPSKSLLEEPFKDQPTIKTVIEPQVPQEVSKDKSISISIDHSMIQREVFRDPPEISQSQSLPLKPEVLHHQPQEDQSINSLPSSVQSASIPSEASALATEVPTAPPLPMEEQSTLNFRRQPSPTSKDNWSKDLQTRNKSAPIPKEDANIPLVTPSLLQMVRLRSVNVEDQVITLSEDAKSETEDIPGQDQVTLSQVIPQKPVRKSCLKSTSSQSSPVVSLGPSMRLQEAIRMKTAAMSSSRVPARLSLRLPSNNTTNSNETLPVLSPKSPDSSELLKSPTSTASFIFSKSTKKVIIETSTSPDLQASLKQNLAAELMQISDQAKSLEAGKKQVKVPPPVAKKPTHVTNPIEKPAIGTAVTSESSSKKRNDGLENGQIETVQPAGQRAQSPGIKMPASNTETQRILEVS